MPISKIVNLKKMLNLTIIFLTIFNSHSFAKVNKELVLSSGNFDLIQNRNLINNTIADLRETSIQIIDKDQIPRAQINAYLSKENQFRLNEVTFLNTTFFISDNKKRSYREVKDECKLLGKNIILLKSKRKNLFEIKFNLFPINIELLQYNNIQFQNIPILLATQVSLVKSDNAISSDYSIEKFKEMVDEALRTQKESINSIGQFNFKAVQIDDVICDIINDDLILSFNYGLMFESAQLESKPLLTVSEIEKIHLDLVKHNSSSENNLNKAIIQGARLNSSLNRLTYFNTSHYVPHHFLLIFENLFTSSTLEVKQIHQIEYKDISQKMNIFDFSKKLLSLKQFVDFKEVE